MGPANALRFAGFRVSRPTTRPRGNASIPWSWKSTRTLRASSPNVSPLLDERGDTFGDEARNVLVLFHDHGMDAFPRGRVVGRDTRKPAKRSAFAGPISGTDVLVGASNRLRHTRSDVTPRRSCRSRSRPSRSDS